MSQNIDKANYMGLLVVNHYVAETPITCLGAQTRASGITEIALYEASYDNHKRQPIKGALISKMRMADWQFGVLVGQTNRGKGHVTTLEAHDGFDVNHPDHEVNIAANELKRSAGIALSSDKQIDRFFNDMEGLASEAITKGRLLKSVQNEIAHTATCFLQNLPANERYHISEFNEIARKRYLEVSNSIHNAVRDAYRRQGEPLLLDNKEETLPSMSATVLLGINMGSNNSLTLFDDINTHESTATMELHTADPYESTLTDNPEWRYTNGDLLWKVSMSPEHYTRFLRADRAEVSCTITRRAGEKIGDVPAKHTAEPIDERKSQSTTLSVEREALNIAVSALIEKLKQGKYRGKAGLNTLRDDIIHARDCYAEHLESNNEEIAGKLEHVLEEQQENIQNALAQEILALPEADREKTMRILTNMVSETGAGFKRLAQPINKNNQ